METTKEHVRTNQPTATDFERWIDDARGGAGRGFTALYEWLSPEVKEFAVGRAARDADAATNDAFVACFSRIGTFQGDARAFRAWVFTAVRNRLIDQHRMEQRRPPVVGDELPVEDRSPSAEDLAMAGLADGRTTALLAELTDAQQEVLLLRVVSELSLEETAEVVGRPVTAVKRLQARALERLRRKLSEEEVS